ncbi:MAG: PilN domain-containing protein [Gemmatimonadetes bacterium]|nr:PilN domain-containing protein [Gemmatimonadota bacterium]
MIEINLLPGARKQRRSPTATVDFRAILGDIGSRIRDPWLISATVGVVLGLGSVGFMYWRTSAKESALIVEQQKAVQDSTRYASVIKDRSVAEAQRDSVTRQIAIIRSIDGARFVWPHVLDEVNKALTPYTWIRSMVQTSAVPAVSPEVEAGVGGVKSKAAAQAEAEEAAASVITIRMIGQTVDIQSLTRFIRQLEDSPWLENVNLTGTADVIVQPANKEVKEFTLDMKIHRPDSTFLRRVPLTVGVR